ncbi:TPA: hypothetical protein I3798_004771 [Enterobacter cloacae]|nr:hypothetical protein [Enterobacter cloacae]HAS1121316.1 hypothetical protein [Enterobacter cloacae]
MSIRNDVIVLTDWTQALAVYDSLNLDDIVNIYLRFGIKGRLNGFPVINIWQGGFCEERVYYAMIYLLERALNELTLSKMSEGQSIVYHVDLKVPVESQTSSIIGTKLYTAAKNLLSLTQKSHEYHIEIQGLTSKNSFSPTYEDAVLRLKKISKKYYQSEKYPFALFIGGFLLYAFVAAILLPEKYQTFESYFMLFLSLLGMWGIARSTQKNDSGIKICKEDVEYLTKNVELNHYLKKHNDITGFISLSDLQLILTLLDKHERVKG